MNGIIILGSPGSGKSVVGKLLNKYLSDTAYVSSGDIARKLAQTDEEIRKLLEVGKMATESQMRSAVMSTLYGLNLKGKMFVLDGFPRTIEQYELLEGQFPNIKYIVINVDESTCAERLINRERSDDSTENIKNRLEFYSKNTVPMITKLFEDNKQVYVYDNSKIKEDYNFVLDVYDILKDIVKDEPDLKYKLSGGSK